MPARSLTLLATLLTVLGASVVLSGCGLLEDDDGLRREDFAMTPAAAQPDPTESPLTSREIKRGALTPADELAPAVEKIGGPLAPALDDVLEQAPIVPR